MRSIIIALILFLIPSVSFAKVDYAKELAKKNITVSGSVSNSILKKIYTYSQLIPVKNWDIHLVPNAPVPAIPTVMNAEGFTFFNADGSHTTYLAIHPAYWSFDFVFFHEASVTLGVKETYSNGSTHEELTNRYAFYWLHKLKVPFDSNGLYIPGPNTGIY